MNVDQNRLQLIIQRLGMPGELLIQSLQDIKEQSFIERQDLLAANPDWKLKTDIRLSSFGKLINICDRTQFSIDILGNMLDDDWCRVNINNNLRSDSGYKTALAVEFEKATKFGFGISIFYNNRIQLADIPSFS
ncbi:MAG TPA: hypothetical protein VHO48_01205 [Anaerolineaceae bacterium]|nr:hypothetical protein [Anaerolineaceae bacterium]